MGLKHLFTKAIPFSKDKKEKFLELSKFLQKKELDTVEHLLKIGKIKINNFSFGLSKHVLFNTDYPHIYTDILRKENEKLHTEIDNLNKIIKDSAKIYYFKELSKTADKSIPKIIAQEIIGMDNIKEAVAIQLFTKEKIHILLLGDPGTGKTDIIRSAASIAPISSFGLGSGTSGVGLSVTFKGKEMIKGIIPLANNGICCIDELNLMKEEDMAALYSAMEKGFITYDKGGNHVTIDAKINVLATANPKTDRFTKWDIETIKKQIPFDQALMTRFHLVFLVKKPGMDEFNEISRKIVNHKDEKFENDYIFLKEYIEKARNIEVTIPDDCNDAIVNIANTLKADEEKLLFEVNPRIVHGLLRLLKASARMNLRKTATLDDVKRIERIIKGSFYFK